MAASPACPARKDHSKWVHRRLCGGGGGCRLWALFGMPPVCLLQFESRRISSHLGVVVAVVVVPTLSVAATRLISTS